MTGIRKLAFWCVVVVVGVFEGEGCIVHSKKYFFEQQMRFNFFMTLWHTRPNFFKATTHPHIIAKKRRNNRRIWIIYWWCNKENQIITLALIFLAVSLSLSFSLSLSLSLSLLKEMPQGYESSPFKLRVGKLGGAPPPNSLQEPPSTIHTHTRQDFWAYWWILGVIPNHINGKSHFNKE